MHPGITYHLAPGLVAGFGGGIAPYRALPATLAGGAVVALLTTGLLSWLGLLEGPSPLPFGGASLEAALVAGVGVVLVAGVRYLVGPDSKKEPAPPRQAA